MKDALRIVLSIILFLIILIVFLPTAAYANHSWNNYHWARSGNPFTVSLGDNVSSRWDPYLNGAAYQWNRSSVLNVPVVAGNTAPSSCKPTTGRVQVCNSSYGNTGWLGLAQLYVSGNHITAATVKLNDTYFNSSNYNTSAWKNLVICQEVGHAFGLGHVDENFNNQPIGTCMDYSSNPTPNQTPNMHDYYQLLSIYRHRDTSLASDDTTLAGELAAISGAPIGDFNDKSTWGNLVKGADLSETTLAGDKSTHIATYERDLGAGKKLNTVVIWAQQ